MKHLMASVCKKTSLGRFWSSGNFQYLSAASSASEPHARVHQHCEPHNDCKGRAKAFSSREFKVVWSSWPSHTLDHDGAGARQKVPPQC